MFALVICGMALTLVSATKPNQNNMNQQQMMMPQDACSNLSAEEQDFAGQLTQANAMTFCSQMSPVQRKKAMQMVQVSGSSGMQMSPDDAVQNVMQNKTQNNMRQRTGGACPVQ